MSGYPPATDVLRAVARFLRNDLLPVTSGREAFNLRVSINAVELVVRELEQAGDAEKTELAGLTDLLGGEGSLLELRAQLAERIRRGVRDTDTAALQAHLRRTAIAQLAIDQPSYSAFLAATVEPSPRAD